MRKCNQAGIALIKRFEGLRLEAYQDQKGLWTIGYGHTIDVHECDVITREEADSLLSIDLGDAEETVDHGVIVPLNDNEFAALCSFVFNVGSPAFYGSSLRRRLNKRHYAAVAYELTKWNHVHGKVSEGLTRRRAAEIALWRTPE